MSPKKQNSTEQHKSYAMNQFKHARHTCFGKHGRIVRSVSTKEGMKVAKAKGRLRGKQPKLTPKQETHLVGLYQSGEHTSAELAELFGVVYGLSDGGARPRRGEYLVMTP